MAGKTVYLEGKVTNEDGTPFAKFTAEYSDMPIEGVVAIEEQIVSGLIQPMVEVGKQLAAAKAAA
jgi:hypothetical protein